MLIYDSQLKPLGSIPDAACKWTFADKLNQVGEMSLTASSSATADNLLAEGNLCKVADKWLTFGKPQIIDQGDAVVTTINALTLGVLLNDALCFPNPNNPLPSCSPNWHDTFTGSAGDAILHYVRVNIVNAPAKRKAKLSKLLAIQPDANVGSQTTYEANWETVAEACKVLAEPDGLVYGFRELNFAVSEPRDRTADFSFRAGGKLRSTTLTGTNPTLTRAIILGQGEKSDRYAGVFTAAANAADEQATGRVIYKMFDRRDTEEADAYQKKADEELAKGVSVTSARIDTVGDIIVEYDLQIGDLVGVYVGETYVKSQVTGVAISNEYGEIRTKISLKDEFKEEELLISAISTINEKLKYQERG